MSTRLGNTNTGPDYITAINNHASDIEALQSLFAASIKQAGAYSAPVVNPFVYAAKATPWSTATSAGAGGRATDNLPSALCQGWFKMNATQAIGIYKISTGGNGTTYRLRAALFTYSTANATWVMNSFVDIFSYTIGSNASASLEFDSAVVTTSSNLRVLYRSNSGSLSVPLSVLQYADVSISASATLSSAGGSVGATAVPSRMGTAPTLYPSKNPNGCLAGYSSLAYHIATSVGTLAGYGPASTGIVPVSGTLFLAYQDDDFNPTAPSSLAANTYAQSGSHDWLGARDSSGPTQLMVSCRADGQTGTLNNPVISLWSIDDLGARVVDRFAMNDNCTTGVSVYAMSPTLFVVQYYNGSSYMTGLYGINFSTTRGAYIVSLVAPTNAGGFGSQIIGAINYSATQFYFVTKDATNTFRLRTATYNSGAGTFSEGANTTFSFGQTIDTSTFVFDGIMRIDTDAFVAYGHTPNTASTTNPISELFTLA